MVHNNDDAMNKIPLKSASGLEDEEKNGGELMQDTAAAEEARREQMRANMLAWMKKLTIGLICFIGIALISYVIISLCFSDWPKSTPNTATKNNKNNNSNNSTIATAAIAATSNLAEIANTTTASTTSTSTATTESTATTTTIATTTTSTTATPTTTTTTIESTTTTTSSTTNPTFKTSTLTDEQPQDLNNNNSSNNAAAAATSEAHNVSDALHVATTPPPSTTLQEPALAASTSPTTPPTPTTKADELADKPDSSDEKFASKLGVYEHAAVCSDKQVCSQIASDILLRNGSAVDATIAAMLCNGLLVMQSMGIGGGLLMNVYVRKTRHAYSIDAREVAPFATEPNMFDANPEDSMRGPQSIAVPGEVMGYHRAHERFGKLPWRELVEPSLKLCASGYYISNHQARALRYTWPYIKNNTHIQSVFLNAATGEPHAAGTLVKPLAQLCNSYQLLADNGPLDFYNGVLSKLLVEDLQELGSSISAYDLETYFADLVSSITMQLGEDTLYAMPPVSSGTVVAHILSILQGYNFTSADMADDESRARTMHRFVEAMKFGFARRPLLGDLRFNDVRQLVSELTNPDFGAAERAKINDSYVLAGPHMYGAQFSSNEDYEGTSHLAVLAPNGDAVSVTSTINTYFGSSLIGPRTGIVLNNAMNDFSLENNFFELPPSPSNVIEARKRAMSSQSPLLLADKKGNVRLAIGAAGGSRILGAIVEVAARVLWFGEDLKTAIDAPRYYHQLLPNKLEYEEERFDAQLLELLSKRGHILKAVTPLASSVVCAIVRNETAIYANADYRKRGGIAGF